MDLRKDGFTYPIFGYGLAGSRRVKVCDAEQGWVGLDGWVDGWMGAAVLDQASTGRSDLSLRACARWDLVVGFM